MKEYKRELEELNVGAEEGSADEQAYADIPESLCELEASGSNIDIPKESRYF